MDIFVPKNRFWLLLVLTCIGVFLFRVVSFSAVFGAVEHDSGWYLGVAKNLALHGIYASYTNTVIQPAVGANPSIHGRFSVQDNNGNVYFPAGVTVGPGYVIPEALIIKVFGSGWWQYRMWPLIGFSMLLVLASFLVWELGGLFSLLLFYLWLWVVPQYTITYAYEAYSEDVATCFMLLSFTLLFLFLKKRSVLLAFLSGLCIALSYLTKQLFLLPSLGIGIFFIWDIYLLWKEKRIFVKKWLLFIAGAAIPLLCFYGYEYWFLISHFGISAWNAVQEDNHLVFLNSGSGLGGLNLQNIDMQFVAKKFMIWLDVGIGKPIIVWLLLLFSPILLLLRIPKGHKVLFSAFFVAVASSFIWFILISPTGWARHAWQGIFIGMILVSVLIGKVSEIFSGNTQKFLWWFIFSLLVASAIQPSQLYPELFFSHTTIADWSASRNIRGLEGFPSTPILSLSDQKEATSYFSQHITENDRVYYAGWFLNAELSALVGKVFFPLDRYFIYNETNPFGGRSYLILGPYQQGMWSFEPPSYVPSKIQNLCSSVVLQNTSYALCVLKSGIPMVNPAYQ